MSREEKTYPQNILCGPFKYRLFKPYVPKEKAMALLGECLETGWIGEGPRVKEFESLVGGFVGNDRITAVNSGTSALEMALNFTKTEGRDTCITTPMTCMATTIAILNAGLKPYFIDIDPTTGLLSAEALLGVPADIVGRTAAVMTVHWGGSTANMSALGAASKQLDLPLIEDAAHALGSETPSTDCGTGGDIAVVGGLNTLSDFTCFSFQAIKHVTTGDGGAVTFRHEKDWLRSKPYKWFGIPRDERVEHILGHSSYDITEAGRKWQMNDIAASIGIASFGELDENLSGRRAVADVYDSIIPEIKEAGEGIDFPVRVRTSAGSSYWLYTILVKDPYSFSEGMRALGIEVSNVHVRNDSYSVTDPYTGGRLELAGLDYFSDHAMCIPIGPWITTEDAEFIANAAMKHGR